MTVGLPTVIGLALIGSAMSVTVLPRLGVDGIAHLLLTVGAWAIAALQLGLVVGLLVRYAPAERPSVRWASAGSAVVVATWIVASLLFGWAGSVANSKSAVGSLTVFLLLTAYVLVSSAIFLVGVELDELGRK